MGQKPTNCHNFVFLIHPHKLLLLLATLFASMAGVLSSSSSAKAQEQSSTEDARDSVLAVPKSPVPVGKRLRARQTLPPPPQENLLNADAFQYGLPPLVAVTNSQQIASAVPTYNQFLNNQTNVLTPNQSVGAIPTFNQLLTNQVTQLPPTPTYNSRKPIANAATPVFNQSANPSNYNSSINNQAALPANSGNGDTVPTFNQLLNSQTAVLPASLGNTAAPQVNQPINQSTGNQAAATYNQYFNNQSAPTFNQLLTNNQPGTVTQVPGATTQEFTAPGTAPTFNQLPNAQVTPLPPLPGIPATVAPAPQGTPVPISPQAQQVPQQPRQIPADRPLVQSTALREPSLRFQGVYVTQGEDSARARLTGTLPLTPNVLFGATLDLTSQGSTFDDSRREGLNINELYFAASIPNLPNLRFVAGQLDLTSYFDRNSFAKDGASQFFNPVFQTNPALAATGIASRPGLLVNWSVTDNIEAKAAAFSSSDRIGDFTLDGFAGEVGIRYGNAIIRGTYATSRDAGNRDTFPESFSIDRGNNRFGPLVEDREEAYGINAEVYIPSIKLGLFGRYGRYENRDLGLGADTYVLGASALDVFTKYDRLGLAYGRALSNDSLRRGEQPDVLELFYDFEFLPSLRLGLSVQGRDSFSDTVFGVRVRTDLDLTPRGRTAR